MTPPPSDCPEFEGDGLPPAGSSDPFPSLAQLAIALECEPGQVIEPELVKNAASAVMLYFKQHLGQTDILPADFASALQKVLHGFGFAVKATVDFHPAAESAQSSPEAVQPKQIQSFDLHQFVIESGIVLELVFYSRLRDEMARQLGFQPAIVHWHGLRESVKAVAGVNRWNRSCQELNDQIVQFLRNHFTASSQGSPRCAFLLN